MVVVDGVDAPLPSEEWVGGYSREALLLFAPLVAELYFLEGEEVVVGLFEELQFFVGVAHDSGLLPLEGFPGEVYIVIGIGGYLADVGQLDGFAQLHLPRLHQH
jgi:hypothetical protein